MRIGVNIYNLYPGKIGGAEQYVRNIIKEFNFIEDVNLFIFVNSLALPTFEESEKQKLCHIDEQGDRDTQIQFFIDFFNIDIMFCPLFFIAPEKCNIPSVASILDIQHEFFPEYFEKNTLKEIRKNTENTLRVADGIITISNYSKKTIIDKYNIDEDKIKVTYLDSDLCFKEIKDNIKDIKLEKNIDSDYIFYPANTWPHKNHINLLKAFKILKEKYHTKLKIVFTGDSKQQKKEIENYIKDNNLQDDILYLGYLKQEEMPYIYANATIMAFPSVFEGFGIPLVEAMRSGVAIACSKNGSIPEVAGDAAIYFDAYNPNDIAEKIYKLEQDKELQQILINKGQKVATRYSWEKCVEDTYLYLKKIVSTNKSQCVTQYEDNPLVTIITPSYNQGEFIKDTIESVLSQDYPNIEYFVMDGGSTDNTIDILESYEGRFYWCSEKDKGQADAINKGIRKANGKIIGWLNSDDTYLENAVSTVVKYFKDHPNTDMVYGEGYYTNKEGQVIERYLTEKFSVSRLAEQCIICQPTVFFTKDIVENVGLLDAEHQLSMDYELWMRISKMGKISYIPNYLATSRMYEENKTLSRRDEVFKETFIAVKKHYGYVPISWIDGYADYLSNGTRGIKFVILDIKLFIQYNLSNWRYLIKGLKRILPHRLYFLKLRLRNENSKFNGKYQDNWISKKYKIPFIVNENSQILNIEGIHNWPLKGTLKLNIYLDNKLLIKKPVKKLGDFNFIFNIEGKLQEGEHELIIIANKTFCPSRLNGSPDSRELSCRINSIRIE